jgi:uncharacterized delta-60 repeat protein
MLKAIRLAVITHAAAIDIFGRRTRLRADVGLGWGATREPRLNASLAEALERRTLLSAITTLASFSGTDGDGPNAGVVLSGGTLYGTTQSGSAGEVFSVPVAGGAPTVLASFSFVLPVFGLAFSGGTLYGTTEFAGEVFSLPATGGTPTVLASLNNGLGAEGGVIVGGNTLYGTTGLPEGEAGEGEVFSLPTTGGTPTILASFTAAPGSPLYNSGLTLSGGTLYGTTGIGNDTVNGEVFSVPTTGGTPSVLATFSGTNGENPEGSVIVDGSTLYGTTTAGEVFSLPTTGGTPTILASFSGTVGLVLSGSTLYGTSTSGGADNDGEIFSLPVTGGTPTVLASFNGTDGSVPQGLTIDSSGNLFGATAGGGASGDGTVFELPNSITVFPPAKVGGLDPTFGVGGVASHDVGITSTAGLAVQGDGKSLIAGTAGTTDAGTFAVTRYNADGSLDTSFGDNGVATTSFGGDDQAAGETLLPNGDTLIAGTATTEVSGQPTGSQFALAEFTPAGALDTSFGNGTGRVLASFSSTGALSNDISHAVVVAPNGTIYVAGSSDANGNGEDFAIAAFNANGTPNGSFNGSGRELLDFSGGNDSADAVTLQSNGELIVAGSTQNPSTGVTSIALVRLLSNGALDSRFGTKGRIVTNLRGVDDEATSVALQPKGQIVVGGESATGSFAAGTISTDFAVLRYTSTGKLDHTFDRSGYVITSFGQDAAVTKVLVQSDGEIVASGKTTAGFNSTSLGQLGIAIARYNANGTPDTTFNGTGRTLIMLTGQSATASLQRPSVITPLDIEATLRQEFEMFLTTGQGIIATTPGGDLAFLGNSGQYTELGHEVVMGIDLAASLLAKLPTSVTDGASVAVTINVTEDGSSTASGVVTIELFISPSSSVGTGDTQAYSKPQALKLKAKQSKSYKLKIKVPHTLSAGSYYLLAEVDTKALRDLNPLNNIFAKGPLQIIS